MASMTRTIRTPARRATSRVMDAEIARVLTGEEGRFPDFTSFIPADLATAQEIRLSHDTGYAVAIVDEHENVRVLPAPVPRLDPEPWP